MTGTKKSACGHHKKHLRRTSHVLDGCRYVICLKCNEYRSERTLMRIFEGGNAEFNEMPMWDGEWFHWETFSTFMHKPAKEDFVTKALKGPVEFMTYVYLTVSHLIGVEGLFAYAAMAYPEYERALQYVNYMYLCVVILHGVHWFQKRLYFVPKMLMQMRPYVEEFTAHKDELGMSPRELVDAIRELRGGLVKTTQSAPIEAPPIPEDNAPSEPLPTENGMAQGMCRYEWLNLTPGMDIAGHTHVCGNNKGHQGDHICIYCRLVASEKSGSGGN